MDKKYEEITWNLEDSAKDQEAMYKFLLGAIRDISRIGTEEVIHDITLRINGTIKNNKTQTEILRKNTAHDVDINSETMECISINGKSPNMILQLINYLNAIATIDPLMTIEMHNKFRREFTSMYYEAFFHEGDKKEWALDSDEINNIFEYRLLRFRIVSRKLNDTIYWRLIRGESTSDTAAMNRPDIWESKLRAYIKEEVVDSISSLKNNLFDFVRIYKYSYKYMDNVTYRVFTNGFKNIYNPYVEEKYTKITIKQINNVLRSLTIPYEVVRNKEIYFIREI